MRPSRNPPCVASASPFPELCSSIYWLQKGLDDVATVVHGPSVRPTVVEVWEEKPSMPIDAAGCCALTFELKHGVIASYS